MPKETQKRKVISLKTKIEILDRLSKGEKSTQVAKAYDMNEATIRTIKKNENSIRQVVAAGTDTSKKKASYVRDIAMESMENALMIWIEDQTQKRMPIDTNAITHKALQIYSKIKEQQPSTSSADKQKPNFSASHGWFERFKVRHSLHNLKIKGEIASGDVNAAKEFPAKLREICMVNSYSADQVFNADETGLFWKRLPTRTYVARSLKTAGGHKAVKDRVTVLLCSNASGDHIMKPLVINKAKTPRAFKGVQINSLPVDWMANKKAWVTADIFNEWFYKCFVPNVKKYLIQRGLPFKALLLIDNAPGHPKDLKHDNVRVVFLPPNTTCLIQPLDQGIISTFKALYLKRTFRCILDQMDNDESLSVLHVWKHFTILDCVKYIALACSDIKNSTLNACWRNIWPQVVDNNAPNITLEPEYSELVELLHLVKGEGFADLEEDDIHELAEDQELDNDDLINMVIDVNDPESDTAEENESMLFTTKLIREGLELGRKLGNHFVQYDTNIERALKFQRDINKCLAQYEEECKQLSTHQPLITDFMSKFSTTEVVTNVAITQPQSPQIISSDDSIIQPTKKKKVIFFCDTDSSD